MTARIDLRLAALTRFGDAIRARVKPIRDAAKSARQQLRSLRTT